MPRVLSIQSSVVHGVVGLNAATLPLQLHGWEVAPLATVSFSNHSGYPARGGAALSADGLADLLAGLAANGVGLGDAGVYAAVLTGYVGRAGTVAALAEAVAAARSSSSQGEGGGDHQARPPPPPGWRLVVDPVLGDDGALYVPPDVPAAYLPLVSAADVLLPNATEAVALLNAAAAGGGAAAAGAPPVPPITTEAGALGALASLHALGPPVVVLTSAAVAEWPGEVVLYASLQGQGQGQGQRRLRLRIPALPRSFTGTGDLLAALVTARLGAPEDEAARGGGRPPPPTPAALAAALEGAVAGVQAVLARTAAAADAAGPGLAAAGVPSGDAGRRHPATLAAAELRLVEAAGELVRPPPGPRAEWI